MDVKREARSGFGPRSRQSHEMICHECHLYSRVWRAAAFSLFIHHTPRLIPGPRYFSTTVDPSRMLFGAPARVESPWVSAVRPQGLPFRTSRCVGAQSSQRRAGTQKLSTRILLSKHLPHTRPCQSRIHTLGLPAGESWQRRHCLSRGADGEHREVVAAVAVACYT